MTLRTNIIQPDIVQPLLEEDTQFISIEKIESLNLKTFEVLTSVMETLCVDLKYMSSHMKNKNNFIYIKK